MPESIDSLFDLAARGWRLIPLRRGEKRPIPAEWQRAATSDPEKILAWADQYPDSNWGVVLGRESGIIDIECDSEAEEAILNQLAGGAEAIPVTPTYQSARGKHRLFKWSADLPCVDKGIFYIGKLGFRTGNGAKGAQSVLPPSIHPVSGEAYRWLVSPDECEPAEIPGEMMARICLAAVEGVDSLQPQSSANGSVPLVMRAWNYIDQIPRSISGNHGHDRLFEAACRLIVGFGLSAGDARELLGRWNVGCQPLWSDEELDHKIKQAREKADAEPAKVGQLVRSKPGRNYERPMIIVDTDELRVNNQTLAALIAYIPEKQPTIFQRCGQLVRVVRRSEAPPSIRFAEGESLKILPLVYANLREILSDAAAFTKENSKGDLVPVRVPRDTVEAILHRKEWPGIPSLIGVSPGPILRPDGSILTTPGYDKATGIFVDDHRLKIETPDTPTIDQAREAAKLLESIFVDFPFEKLHHRAAAVSAILTHFARWAVQDNAPLFAIDANQAGTGKGLLVDVITLVTCGSPVARTPMPGNDEEWRKQITSAVIAGTGVILLDNQSGPFGNPILDAALTSRRWQDRVLGKSELVSMLLDIVWFATGNNLEIIGDTVRRVCRIRMISPCENPEDRSGFQFPDIRRHVLTNRSQLASAALTVLRGYIAAGMPDQGLRPWGSFEAWSKLVRGSLVWAGLADPALGRLELKEQNTESRSLRTLFDEWPNFDPDGRGVTAKEFLRQIHKSEALSEAVLTLCRTRDDKPLTTPQVGAMFRRLKNRVVGDRTLTSDQNRDHTTVWLVSKLPAA